MTTSRRSRQTSFVDGSEPEPGRMWLTPTTAVTVSVKRDVSMTKGMADRYRRNGGGGNLLEQVAAEIFPEAGCSPPATPASRSATPGSGPERMTPGTSGRGFSACLPASTPTVLRGFVLRMSEGTSAWGSTVCSLTWTTSATPQRRGLFLLRASARSTAGTGSGSSDAETIWPTPRAGKTTDEDEGAWRARQERGDVSTPPLSLAVKMWPTPRAEGHDAMRHRGKADTLNAAVKVTMEPHLYPTPDASGEKYRLGGDSQQSRCLEAMARRGELDGTPPRSGQKLNPDFVSRLMGYPDGWTVLSDSDPA